MSIALRTQRFYKVVLTSLTYENTMVDSLVPLKESVSCPSCVGLLDAPPGWQATTYMGKKLQVGSPEISKPINASNSYEHQMQKKVSLVTDLISQTETCEIKLDNLCEIAFYS